MASKKDAPKAVKIDDISKSSIILSIIINNIADTPKLTIKVATNRPAPAMIGPIKGIIEKIVKTTPIIEKSGSTKKLLIKARIKKQLNNLKES